MGGQQSAIHVDCDETHGANQKGHIFSVRKAGTRPPHRAKIARWGPRQGPRDPGGMLEHSSDKLITWNEFAANAMRYWPSTTQADWCPACGGALTERKSMSEKLPHAVEVDHRGIVLPRRHALGGIITPQLSRLTRSAALQPGARTLPPTRDITSPAARSQSKPRRQLRHRERVAQTATYRWNRPRRKDG